MIDALNGQLIVLGDLNQPDAFQPLLAQLEQEPLLAPAHWGAAPGIRDRYDRQALLAHIRQLDEDQRAPHVMRKKPFRYDAIWYSEREVVSSFQLESELPVVQQDVSQVCEAFSRLAAVVPLEFGHIDLRFEGQDKSTRMYRSGSLHHLSAYATKGPSLLFVRNYFGPRLIEMMGGEAVLKATGCPLQTLDNGAIQLDLVADPWNSDPAALKDAQNRVLAVLRSTGVFTQAVGPYSEEPGPKWMPLLGDIAVHPEPGTPFK